MRLFFDTNVLARALGTRDLCLDLLRLVLDEHELLATPRFSKSSRAC